MQKKNILIVAGEASSELYARRLMTELKKRSSDLHFFGVGSRAMEVDGFEVIEHAENLAVVGISEVFEQLPVIIGAFKKLEQASLRLKPDLVILLDLPDFNLRLAKKLKKQNRKIFYYISPQLWAWRKGRVKIVKECVDKMLVVFPFEETFYQEHGVQAKFVGHPLLDELKNNEMSYEKRGSERARYGVTENHHFVGLLPGSRRSELLHHLESQVRAAEIIKKEFPESRFFLLVAPTLETDFVKSLLPSNELNLTLIRDEPLKILPLADSLMVTSGTATLFAGLAAIPMVVMYRVKFLSFMIAKSLIRNVPFFGLPNLLLKKMLVPELLQYDVNPEKIADALRPYLKDREVLNQTKQGLLGLRSLLGDHGATSRVADEVMKVLEP